MNLAVDIERWFTLPVEQMPDHAAILPTPREVTGAIKALGHAILQTIPDTSGQQTFLLQQLRLALASVVGSYYQPPHKTCSDKRFPAVPILNTSAAAQPIVTAGTNLLRILMHLSVHRTNSFAIDTLLAVLTMSQLILLAGISDNT